MFKNTVKAMKEAIKEMREQGYSHAEIAEKLGMPSTDVIPITNEIPKYVYADAVKAIRKHTNYRYSVAEILDILEADEMYLVELGVMTKSSIKSDFLRHSNDYLDDECNVEEVKF